jgi:hypothetical protein
MSQPRCVVLVPVCGTIEPDCEAALQQLERSGVTVRRVRGDAAPDAARSQMATDALADGFDELVWVNPDVLFRPDDVAALRARDRPLVCGVCPKKGPRQFACAFLPGTRSVTFGRGGGLTELRYCGFGFVYTRREVYEAIRERLRLPACNQRFGRPLVPYFAPLAVEDAGGAWYLSADYAFCERARQSGFRVLADTTVRLWQVGPYRYGWEDAGRDTERFATYHFRLADPADGEAAPPGGSSPGSEPPSELEPENPRLDRPPPAAASDRRRYVLCAADGGAAARLARRLRDAGVGVPHEYFRPDRARALSGRWGVAPGDRDGYVQALLRHRTAPNGAWGVVLSWQQYHEWRAALDATALGGAKLVYLEPPADAGMGPIPVPVEEWETFFAERGDDPLRVRPEDLDREPAEVVERVARLVGLRPGADGQTPPGAAEPAVSGVAESPRHPLRGPARPLPPGFPRLRAYVVTYAANRASARLTLGDFRRSDWGAEPLLFVQPADWPVGFDAAARNYKRALEHAAADGCDFALLLEDDVRVCRHLRHNLTALPLVARDQCDFLSLYVPDLVADPWERAEPHLGYRLARPRYSGPNRMWQKHRLWGSQAYLLSRRFILAALERWDRLKMGLDSRVISVCSAWKLPMWYTAPCLVQHAPLRSAHATPLAHAPDFDPDFRLEVEPGFQPPEEVPGWLTAEEGHALWRAAAGRSVLEPGGRAGDGVPGPVGPAGRVRGPDRDPGGGRVGHAVRRGRAGRVAAG